MPATSARYGDVRDADSSPAHTSGRTFFPKFYAALDATPRWEAVVVPALVKFAGLPIGWDSYGAPPPRRDAGLFALEILQSVMRPRTPPPQVIPSSAGGIQLEWHENGIDLELHITAPYQWELWFQDHQN